MAFQLADDLDDAASDEWSALRVGTPGALSERASEHLARASEALGRFAGRAEPLLALAEGLAGRVG